MSADGLIKIGEKVKKGTPLFEYYDTVKNENKSINHKDYEKGYVDHVSLLTDETDVQDIRVNIKIRYTRNPIIGDKFSSRHGQKGVLSVLWP